jgi:UPF0755 protein
LTADTENSRVTVVEPQLESFPDPPRRRGRRILMVLAAFAAVVLLTAGAAAIYVNKQINPGGKRGIDVHLTIPLGSSTSHIADLLAARGVIHSATVFRWYVRVKGAPSFQAGDYTLPKNESYDSVIAVLKKGPEIAFDRITIPEGFTLAQIADRVGKTGRSAQRFLDAAQSGQVRSRFEPAGSNNLEGLLAADTYFIEAKDDEVAILQRMVQGFDTEATQLGIDQAAVRLNMTPYQIINVASMVEREAKVPEDRGPVASVIYNRLKIGQTLGIDATLVYGTGHQILRQSDLDSNNPYNTRKIKGLPPTPIASPGRPSLEAAINPPTTTFRFYVLADASGKHAFASTDAEFARLAAECRAKKLC